MATVTCKASNKSNGSGARHERTAEAGATSAGATAAKQVRCRRVPFNKELPIAEASGAVLVPANKTRPLHLLVVGDSGTNGQFNEIAADDGRVLRSGRLPLDGRASDDLEGLTRLGDTFYVITSSGWVRHYRLDANDQYQQVARAYPIAKRSRYPQFTCKAKGVNCGKNYEGLCVVSDAQSRPKHACIGFAASKADGHLYCLRLRKGGRLRLDPKRKIQVSGGEQLTGCHFAADGSAVYAGTNLFGRSEVVRISGWAKPATATIKSIGGLGSGFPEALAVAPGGMVYRFSDMGGAPSLVDKYLCK